MPLDHAYYSLLEVIQERAGHRELNQDDYNFRDYHNKSLLYYASASGDLGTIKALIAKGADIHQLNGIYKRSALEIALQNGHLPVVEILYDQGAKLFKMGFYLCHESTKPWLHYKILETIHEIQKNNLFTNQIIHQKSLSVQIRLAEVYQPSFHAEYLDQLLKTRKDNKEILTSLWYAVYSKRSDYVEKVLTFSGQFNPTHKSCFSDNAFILAVSQNNFEMADKFITNGANADCEDNYKRNIFLNSIIDKSLAGIDYALEHYVDLLSRDIYGNNALHYLFVWQNEEAYQKIHKALGALQFKFLYHKKNIYGISPENIDKDKQSLTPQSLIIEQRKLNRSIKYYLRYHNRSTDFLANGNCHGYGLLFQYYAQKQKFDYFYTGLSLLADWDGDIKKLDQVFSRDIPQSKFYNTLRDFFEGWISYILWLQHHTTVEDFSQLHQTRSNKLISMVTQTEDRSYLLGTFNKRDDKNIVSATIVNYYQLRERLSYFLRLPSGYSFHIGGSAHFTDATITETGTVVYFDSNIDHRINPIENPEVLTQLIRNYKYILLSKFRDDGRMEMYCDIWSPSEAIFMQHAAEFELFKENELPKTVEEANLFRSNSPSNFTHLHLAVLFYSEKNILSLLKTGIIDIHAEDAFGKTALDYAVYSNNHAFIIKALCFHHSPINLKQINLFSDYIIPNHLTYFLRHFPLYLDRYDFLVDKCHAGHLKEAATHWDYYLNDKFIPYELVQSEQIESREKMRKLILRGMMKGYDNSFVQTIVLFIIGEYLFSESIKNPELILECLCQLLTKFATNKPFISENDLVYVFNHVNVFSKIHDIFTESAIKIIGIDLFLFDFSALEKDKQHEYKKRERTRTFIHIPNFTLKNLINHFDIFVKIIQKIPLRKLLLDYPETTSQIMARPNITNRLLDAGARSTFFLIKPFTLLSLYDHVDVVLKLTDPGNAYPLTFQQTTKIPSRILSALSDNEEKLNELCENIELNEYLYCKNTDDEQALLSEIQDAQGFNLSMN